MSKPASKRPAKNARRHTKQDHLLDVKIRASTERRRTIARTCSITFRILLIGSLLVGGWLGGKEALRKFVFESADYAIKEVKYATDGTLTREQVLKAGDLSEGRNIFLVNLGKARAAIEKMPQVECVEVTRTLPNLLSVAVTERRPIAWVISNGNEDATVSDNAFLIDASGMLMKPKARLLEYLHFPRISGVETGNLVAGERVTTSEMQAALELIRLTSESTRFQALNIDLSKGYCLVVTAEKQAKVTFGLEHIETQLARLHRYLAQAAEDQMEIQAVNLIVERNTPVTLVKPAPAEGEVPEAPKPVDPKAKPTADAVPEKAKPSAAPAPVAPRAMLVAPSIPVAPTPAAKPVNFPNFFKTKAGATPTPVKTQGVKKQPFRLH